MRAIGSVRTRLYEMPDRRVRTLAVGVRTCKCKTYVSLLIVQISSHV